MKTQGIASGLLAAAFMMIGVGCTINNSPTTGGGISGTGSNPPGAPLTLSAFATLGSTATFQSPDGIQYTNGHLWIADGSNNTLQEWATNGASPVTTLSSYASGVSFFISPEGVGLDPVSGNVYAADPGNNQVEVFNSTGTYLTSLSANLSGSLPAGVAVNSAGTTLYDVGSFTHSVYVYSISVGPSFSPVTVFGASGTTGTTLNAPQNIHLDSSGNVWVADLDNQRLAEYSAAGTFTKSVTGASGFSPTDFAFDSNKNIYATDINTNAIIEFDKTGSKVNQAVVGVLSNPQAITSNGSGTFYVTDTNNSRIVAFH